MALQDDVVDFITSQITTIGLADGPTVGDELSGNGYAPIAPTYAASSNGSADITNGPLEFSGPANAAVSHLIFRTADDAIVVALDSAGALNSDGRYDVDSAPITNAIGS